MSDTALKVLVTGSRSVIAAQILHSPLAATSARLARMTGALSGLVSKNRALPGMFAPTNQELALVRRI